MDVKHLNFSEVPEGAILLPDGDTAKPVTVSGWVSRNGIFHLGSDAERLARWDGSTHRVCEEDGCSEATARRYMLCDNCRSASQNARFKALKAEPLSFPVCIFNDDTYFFDMQSLEEYVFENDTPANELQLVHCYMVKLREIDVDHFLEDLHEGADLPDDVAIKMDELNAAIMKSETDSWMPSNIAVSLTDDELDSLGAAYDAGQAKELI